MTTLQGFPQGSQSTGCLHGKNILSVSQLSREDVMHICDVAGAMRKALAHTEGLDLLRGKILANLFYEPSTRTQASFMAAMLRLGGSVIPISEIQHLSVAKGESLADTVRTLNAYADAIVLRHPEMGAAHIAASYAQKPVINAGDGAGEHPTQALLDLFTIQNELGHLNGLTVTLLGDLKYGRTVHSLARLLAHFDTAVHYVSPEQLRMPPEIVQELAGRSLQQTAHTSLDGVLELTDVLYVTRVQKERFDDISLYETLKHFFVITPAHMKRAKRKMALMHPLPRSGEITEAVDADVRAAYFRQVEYGLFVRMALLAMVFGKA